MHSRAGVALNDNLSALHFIIFSLLLVRNGLVFNCGTSLRSKYGMDICYKLRETMKHTKFKLEIPSRSTL